METNRIRKTIAILLVVLFLVSLTASAVSAVQRWGPEGNGRNPSQMTYIGASVKFTEKSPGTTSMPEVYGNKVIWTNWALEGKKVWLE
jgi:hypothetical protein